MTSPDDLLSRNGQLLTRRVWAMLDAVADETGLTVYVGQGGHKLRQGGGAGASAGTHDIGDVFDISLSRVPESSWVRLNTALRRWNACAWVRSPAYGWTSTGPHIHGVMRDSAHGLSTGARDQVRAYDAGKNGLKNGAPDPFPRPTQQHYPPAGEDPEVITQQDIDRIAEAAAHRVWNRLMKDPVTSSDASAASLLLRTRRDANTAATRTSPASYADEAEPSDDDA